MIRIDFFRRTQSQALVLLSVAVLTLCIAGTFSLISSNQELIATTKNIRNGMYVCSNRAGQSYFAYSQAQWNSSTLATEYLAQTSDCYEQLSQQSQGFSKVEIISLAAKVFDEYLTFKNVVLGGVQASSAEVAKTYNAIEQTRYELGLHLAKAIKDSDRSLSIWNYVLFALISLLAMTTVIFFFVIRKRERGFREIEGKAVELLANLDQSAHIQNLFEKVFSFLQLPALKNLFLDYHAEVLEKGQSYRVVSDDSENEYRSSVSLEKKDFQNPSDYVQNVTAEEVKRENAFALEAHLDDKTDLLEGIQAPAINEPTIKEPLFNHRVVDEDNDGWEVSNQLLDDDFLVQSQNLEYAEVEDEITAVDINDLGNTELKKIALKANEISSEKSTENKSTQVQPRYYFRDLVAMTTRAFMRNNRGENISWEFASNAKDFEVVAEFEVIEQVIQSLLAKFNKAFHDFNVPQEARTIQATQSMGNRFVQLFLTVRGVLFNTSELEYFNTPQAELGQQVDRNLSMVYELIHEIGGQATIQNSFGLDGEKEIKFNFSIPMELTGFFFEERDNFLKRLVKGTKRQILNSFRKESTPDL
ncbi:MAG: hypothetical protein H6621_03465 [Halobacteriovoraceae bacterium]|nr:hypothetical protein [Halobacteriovoraceae bacterium]MCB9094106.1 hypothetical protein [Halobacteriovoraceae bacterium]